MQLVVLFCLAFVSFTSAFRAAHPRALFSNTKLQRLSDSALRMCTSEPKNEIVPIDRNNMQSAAAVTGGVLGLLLAGPFGAVLLAAITNYVSKKDDEAGEAVRGFGKTALESVNFLTKINRKFQITDKVTESVSKSIESVAEENETIGKVKDTYSTTVSKLDDLNKEYDLVTKGKEVIGAAATLSDTAISKAIEINEKYDLVGSATKAAATVVDKLRDQVNKSS